MPLLGYHKRAAVFTVWTSDVDLLRTLVSNCAMVGKFEYEINPVATSLLHTKKAFQVLIATDNEGTANTFDRQFLSQIHDRHPKANDLANYAGVYMQGVRDWLAGEQRGR